MGRLIHWPAGLRVSGMTPLSGPRAIGAGGSESLTGYIQTVAGVFGAWRWQLKCAPMKGEAFRRYRGTVAALHGGANALRVPFDDPDALRSSAGYAVNRARHVLYLPFDGADAATETFDGSFRRHALTFHGNAQLDTAQKAFGAASLLLDGTGDYVSVANHADFRIAAGEDFTIKARVRFVAISSFVHIVGVWNAAANRRSWVLFATAGGANPNRLQFALSSNGTSGTTVIDTPQDSLTTGVFHDIEVARRAGTIRVYIDGVEQGTASDNGAAFVNSVDDLTIGGTVNHVNGWIDQLEIIKDLGVHAAAFTPAAEASPLSIGENVAWGDGSGYATHHNWVAVSASASLGASEVRLAITDWGATLDVGDWLGFAPYHFGLYMVTEAIAPGRYRIWPPLRKALTTHDFAHRRPVMAMRLENEDAASAGRALDASDGAALTLIEVMHPDVVAYFSGES